MKLTAAAIATVIAVLLCAPLPAAADAVHRKGDHVLFSGQVTDAGGEPVGNVTVLLELSRNSFSWRRLKKVKRNTLRIPVTATVDGQYLHDWRWDGYYNTFELAVAIPRSGAGAPAGDDYEVLHRTDVTATVLAGKRPQGTDRSIPVVTPLVVEGVGDLGWLRRLLGGKAGAEENRIFGEMGRPDRVDADDGGASAWWYFEAGKVFRFRDGALEQVEHFEPIKPLD